MTKTLFTANSQWRSILKASCTICIDKRREEDFLEDHPELETPTNYAKNYNIKSRKIGS
jgi:hypothetical protein